MKKCPYCAEDIQDAAIVCRYCGRDLPKEVKIPQIQCPFCAEKIPEDAGKCPYCEKVPKMGLQRREGGERFSECAIPPRVPDDQPLTVWEKVRGGFALLLGIVVVVTVLILVVQAFQKSPMQIPSTNMAPFAVPTHSAIPTLSISMTPWPTPTRNPRTTNCIEATKIDANDIGSNICVYGLVSHLVGNSAGYSFYFGVTNTYYVVGKLSMPSCLMNNNLDFEFAVIGLVSELESGYKILVTTNDVFMRGYDIYDWKGCN